MRTIRRMSRLRSWRALAAILTAALCVSGLAAVGSSSVAGAAVPPSGYGTGSAFCSQAVPGGAVLHYSFDGVFACGPANNSGTGYEVPAPPSPYAGFFEDSGYEFQCTELANRVLFDVWTLSPVSDDAFNGENLVGVNFAATVNHYNPSVAPLIPNGMQGIAYLPGDIVSFSDGGDGHVAVVAKSTENSSGDGTVTLLEENGSKSGKTTATVTNWVMSKPADSSIEVPVNFDALASPPTPPPTVTNFSASPSTLPSSGGQVTLSANVTNATSCTFTSKPTIAGFVGSVPCSTGPVSTEETVPANVGKKAVSYKFALAVTGTKSVKATTTLSVAATAVEKINANLFIGSANITPTLTQGTFPSNIVAGDPISGMGIPAGTTVTSNGLSSMILSNTSTRIRQSTLTVELVSKAGRVALQTLVSDATGGYCKVLSTGGVDCWGDNSYGELGNGTIGGPDGVGGYDTPQAVTGITDAASIYNNDNYINDDGYCALLSTGGVDCWGDNSFGELGNGTIGGPDGANGYDTPQAVTGISNAVSLASDGSDDGYGDGYCAVLSTGAVDCWGTNERGQLGIGAIDGPDGNEGYDTPQVVVGLTGAVSISGAGGDDSTGDGYCALLSSGGVDCWGDNLSDTVGNGMSGGPDGVGGYDSPQAVSGLTTAVSLSTDDSSYCAVLSNGGVDCWGNDYEGSLGGGVLGNGATGNADSPQAVSGITDAVSVSSDHDWGYCAVLSTGGVDCWGDNEFGQLGNGTIGGPGGEQTDPGYDTPQTVSSITDATSVFPAGSSYCAVLATGGVDCWGANTNGELGNGTVGGPDGPPDNYTGYDTPQMVVGVTNAFSVEHDCAVLATGAVDCWGYNGDGEVGNGTIGGPDGADGYDTPQSVSGL